ncbi:hypothetical protein N9W38_00775 [Flavobacteriaceae bacterium]|nr:hypothetical protein [Flavobacteriaceae bacterium]
MKKLLLLLLTVLLFSCGESNSNSSNNVSINPPSWIQGVWVDEELLAIGLRSGYEFKIDDLCQVISSSASCNKETLAIFDNNEDDLFADVQEEISAIRYAIDITIQSSTTSYIFEKIDNNNIIQKGVGGQVIDNILTRE